MLAALIDGMEDGADIGGAGAAGVRRTDERRRRATATARTCRPRSASWSCAGATSACCCRCRARASATRRSPSVADDEQLARFDGQWAAMAITEPEAGSDSAAIRTTAVLDGDEYVLNGEKIYVTAGERADLVVVWATLDREQGRAAIKSFVVERSNPGLILERLEHKLGIRASDTARSASRTAACRRRTCSARPTSTRSRGVRRRDADVRQHAAARRRDGGRPGARVPRATRELLAEAGRRGRLRPARARAARRRGRAARDGGRLRGRAAADAAGRVDGRQRQAELAAGLDGKAKAGRTVRRHRAALRRALRQPRLRRGELLEKWARDAKILDIFEGTQQIQLLIIARQLLGKTSAELKLAAVAGNRNSASEGDDP